MERLKKIKLEDVYGMRVYFKSDLYGMRVYFKSCKSIPVNIYFDCNEKNLNFVIRWCIYLLSSKCFRTRKINVVTRL